MVFISFYLFFWNLSYKNMYTHDQRYDLFLGPSWWLSGSDFRLPMQESCVWSLIREGVRIPHAVWQKEKKKKRIFFAVLLIVRKFKNKINVHNGGMIKLTMVTQVYYLVTKSSGHVEWSYFCSKVHISMYLYMVILILLPMVSTRIRNPENIAFLKCFNLKSSQDCLLLYRRPKGFKKANCPL